MNEKHARIDAIFAEHLCVEPERVVPEARLMPSKWQVGEDGHLGADSLDVVELAMALEDEFRIKIPDDEAQGLTTVGDWYKIVDRLTGTS